MFPVKIPAFGEANYTDHQENQPARVVLMENAAESFGAYCTLLQQAGFEERERQIAPHRGFAAYEKDGWGVFINAFYNNDQLQILMEENTRYFAYEDAAGEICTTPRLTQTWLSDYGLSDVIRLSDGRLVIIDGGNVYDADMESLYNRIKKDSPFEKPVIAAWIMTHPHSDHYFCFFPFMKKYGEEVVLEKMLFNFPEADDQEHYPKLAKDGKSFAKWSGIEGITGGEVLAMFREKVAEMGIPVYTPHTGQRYKLGDAKLLFMGTMDDTIHCSQNINATSLMFIMELGGQKVFFGGDGSFSDASLAQRYGKELKVDILQIPHHGFGCGTEEGQIQGYKLMQPQVCLLPAEKDISYTSFTTYREGTRFLMTQMNVQEMITGEKEKPLELPYTPDIAGASELHRRYVEGREDAGARTWVFSDLNTGRPADFEFSILNTTYIVADIKVELYFENMQRKIIRRKITGPRLGVFRVNCMLTAEDDPQTFDIKAFLESNGIPANTYFSVRFRSKLPVVISHREHKPAYRSSIVD